MSKEAEQGNTGAEVLSSEEAHTVSKLPMWFVPAGLLLTYVLYAFSFPIMGWGALGHVALVPWCVASILSKGGWRHYLLQYFTGVLFWLYMMHWLIQVTAGGWLGVCIYMGFYWPLAAWLLRKAVKKKGLKLAIFLPLIWGSLEWFRARYVAGGFSWFQIGHSQTSFNPINQEWLPWLSYWPRVLVQSADLIGEIGVSLILLLVNGMIAEWVLGKYPALQKWLKAREIPSHSLGLRKRLLTVLAIYAVFLLYGVFQLTYSDYQEKGPVVAAVQTQVRYSLTEAPSFERVESEFNSTLDLAADANMLNEGSSIKPDLIAVPEGAIPFALNTEGLEWLVANRDSRLLWLKKLRELAGDSAGELLLGANSYRFRSEDLSGYPRVQNSAFQMDSDGQIQGQYSKMHLVPFGEYLPWVENIPSLKAYVIKMISPWGEDYTIMPGESPVAFQMVNHPEIHYATPICYEDTVAGQCRKLVTGKASFSIAGEKKVQFLANLTNSSWYGGQSQRIQHVQVASLRCIENRVPMLRSVNTGVSCIIDAKGNVTELAGEDMLSSQQHAGIVVGELKIDRRLSLYGRLGELPALLLFIAGFLLVFTSFRSSRASQD